MHQQYLCGTVANANTIRTTDANRLEKKDQALKPSYV